MKEDIDELSRKLPHDEIVMQWDLPLEIAIWEGHVDTYLSDPRRDVVMKLCEMIEHVPLDVEVGLHLCYGDVSHQHWKEPNLALMVEFANFVQHRLERAIDYLHFPVPRSWTDAGHFRALGDLDLRPGTRVFLGLVHMTDGIEGAKKRIASAETYLGDFGLAASCGLGRRKPADIPAILSLHREAAEISDFHIQVRLKTVPAAPGVSRRSLTASIQGHIAATRIACASAHETAHGQTNVWFRGGKRSAQLNPSAVQSWHRVVKPQLGKTAGSHRDLRPEAQSNMHAQTYDNIIIQC